MKKKLLKEIVKGKNENLEASDSQSEQQHTDVRLALQYWSNRDSEGWGPGGWGGCMDLVEEINTQSGDRSRSGDPNSVSEPWSKCKIIKQ